MEAHQLLIDPRGPSSELGRVLEQSEGQRAELVLQLLQEVAADMQGAFGPDVIQPALIRGERSFLQLLS